MHSFQDASAKKLILCWPQLAEVNKFKVGMFLGLD